MLKELKQMVATMEAEQVAAEAVKPPRTISIMARNVQYGDFVNFPIHGFREVNGYTNHTDTDDTVLSAVGTGGAVHTFPGHKRVQVRRYA